MPACVCVNNPWGSDTTFQFLTAVLLFIKSTWASRPCALINRYRHFEGSLWLLLQGKAIKIQIKFLWLFITPLGFTFQRIIIEAIWWINECLTPWSRFLPETLIFPQLLRNFLYFMDRNFITAFTKACHLSPYHKLNIEYGYVCAASKRASVSLQCGQYSVKHARQISVYTDCTAFNGNYSVASRITHPYGRMKVQTRCVHAPNWLVRSVTTKLFIHYEGNFHPKTGHINILPSGIWRRAIW